MKCKITLSPIVFSNNGVDIIYQPNLSYYTKTPDYDRENFALIKVYQNIFYSPQETIEDYCKRYSLFEKFAKFLNKEKTIDLIGTLPTVLNVKSEIITDFYAKVYCWLYYWARDLPTSELQRQIPIYECFALESIKRYEMIKALFSRKVVDEPIFINSHLAWLLAETSILEQGIANNIVKEENYRKCKAYIDTLMYDEQPSIFKIKNADIEHYARNYFDSLGFVTAKNDSTFNKGYFKPYLINVRHANSQAKKFFKSLPEQKKKPGRKLGSKKPEC